MICTKCGSENMNAQVVNLVRFKQGKGCLWTFLFGFFYFTWLIIKWTYKCAMYLSYWIFWGFIAVLIASAKKEKYIQPIWLKRMMERHGKAYNEQETFFVCQQCGNKQKA